MKPRKQKKCKACGILFTPEKAFQVVCDYRCGLKHAQNQAKKAAERKNANAHKEAKERIKTRSAWMREAEDAFRRFIRARDRLHYLRQGRLPECISCGTTNQNIQYAAGHFKTKGAYPELRLDELNCHLQCNKRCNKELSGNINGTKTTRGYIAGLELRHGIERAKEIIDYLESKHDHKKWTISDLAEKKKQFSAKAREYEKEILALAVAVTYEDGCK